MRTKTNIYDFDFRVLGYGCYEVTYTSPASGKYWRMIINDMTLIDATRNADKPKKRFE